jgi:hypothetical protein
MEIIKTKSQAVTWSGQKNRNHRGDGIPNLLLQQEYAHAEGKILE